MPNYRIPNLANACRLLKGAAEANDVFSVGEMSEKLGVPRTTVLRIAHTLAEEGFLFKVGTRYQLSGALFTLGLRAGNTISWEIVADPVLERLAQQTIETAHLAVWDRDAVLLVRVWDSPHPLRMASRAGTLVHPHASATGKVLLAHGFLSELATIWPASSRKMLTPNTLITVPELQKELQRVLHQGYAFDNEEYIQGARCLAAPVFDFQGKVCAAIGITASASRFTPARDKEMIKLVQHSAQELSLSFKNLLWTSPQLPQDQLRLSSHHPALSK